MIHNDTHIRLTHPDRPIAYELVPGAGNTHNIYPQDHIAGMYTSPLDSSAIACYGMERGSAVRWLVSRLKQGYKIEDMRDKHGV